MHARVGIGQVKPGMMHELERRLQETLYRRYEEQQGFRGAMLLTDPSTGKAMSISLWENESDLKAGEDSTAKERASLTELFSAQRMRETYQVTNQLGSLVLR